MDSLYQAKGGWHRMSPEDGQKCLVECASAYETRNAKRKSDAIQLMRLYEGESVSVRRNGPLNADTPSDSVPVGDDVIDITLNIAQSLVDTLDAKIAGLEKTKPQIVTTEAKWDVKRRAILTDRFIEGQFNERQGRFNDLWEVFRFAFRLGQASTRTAAVKFFSEIDEGKVKAEVHDCLNMWMDTAGAVYDYPQSMGEATYWDPERLADIYGKKYPGAADDIMAAKCTPKRALGLELLNDDAEHFRDHVERVMVVEGWRFKQGKRRGVYCMTFPGAKEPLEWAPYDHEDPPFVFIGGQRSLTSFWHRTLLQPVVAPILRVNEILSSIDRAERLTPKGVMFFDPEEVSREMLQVGDDYELIPVPGLSSMKGKPIYEAPAPFHPLCMDLIKFYIEQCYALPGISEMHALADVKGDWSGAALRIRKQLINERFSTIQSAYVHATTVEASKQIVRCAKEIAAASGGRFTSAWKGEGFIREIDSNVLGVLDEYKYDVGVYPVSETKNTPESRAQLAEELMSTQVITGEAYVSILEHFDTMGEANSANDEQKRLIGMQIDKWLTAEPKEMQNKRFYRGPIRAMDLYSAVVQVNKAYMKALADDVDDRRLTYFKRYLAELQKFIMAQQSQQAGAMQAAGGTVAAAQQLGGPMGQQPAMPIQQ